MTPWYLRTWPDADRLDEVERTGRPDDEPAEGDLADEESSRVERDLTKDW